jgi:hypothetical protein
MRTFSRLQDQAAEITSAFAVSKPSTSRKLTITLSFLSDIYTSDSYMLFTTLHGGRMRLKRSLWFFIPILIVLAIFWAWRPTKTQSGTMLKSWAESVQNLGVRAVYPLQESLYPGNFLLVPTYPGKANWSDEKPDAFYTKYPARVGSLDLCRLYSTMRDAPELPQITSYERNGGVGAEDFVTPWQPTEIKYSHFKCEVKAGDFRVNRAMAFPAFQFRSIVESGVGGNMLTGMAAVLGSLAGNNEYIMTVSIPSATVIKVEIHDLLKAVTDGRYATAGGVADVQTVIDRMMKLQTFVDKNGNSSPPELLLVSEVYYANAIDISITSSAAKASELAVSTQALAGRFDQLTALRDQLKVIKTDVPVAQGSNQGQPNTEPQQAAIKDLVRQIAEKEAEVDNLSKAILPGAPGVTGSVKSVSSTGVTLTQVFPRPMAIGYRATGFNPTQFLKISLVVPEAFRAWHCRPPKICTPGMKNRPFGADFLFRFLLQ